MRVRSLWMAAAGIALAAFAAGQTKTTGTIECNKPDPSYKIDIGDQEGHAFVISKVACTWTKGMEMEGTQTKDGESVGMADAKGMKVQEHGYHVSNMANGDKIYVRYQGTGTMGKDGKPVSSKGTWSYSGGTGKLKGIKGKGTYEGKPSGDDKMTFQVEGEYTLPAAKPAK